MSIRYFLNFNDSMYKLFYIYIYPLFAFSFWYQFFLRPMCLYAILYHSDRMWYKLLRLLPSATLPEYDIAQCTYCFHLWCKAVCEAVYNEHKTTPPPPPPDVSLRYIIP